MGYLQAKYGIAFPAPTPVQQSDSSAGAGDSQASELGSTQNEGASAPAAMAWADPRHPEIDYSLQPFSQAHSEGDKISGWWTIKSEKAAVDDSPQVTAVNYSAFNPNDYMGATALIARCVEGETAVIFVQSDFIMDDYQSHRLDMTLRIDEMPAEQARWNSLTTSKGAGLFGNDAEEYLRKLYGAEQLFLRLTESNGNHHDAKFSLAGKEDAFDSVAAACGWTTLSLTKDDYKAIQTMLNAGGFDAGTPDGQWGTGSQKAMKAFQSSVGLPPTGAPDRATLEQLGLGK